MTQEEMNTENALVLEKYEVIKKLDNYLHNAAFDRITLTSDMLKELKGMIDEMLLSDF
jgi:hypothetical protein